LENALDILLASSVQRVIEENLGKKTVEKIEDRLFERYGMNLTQAIKDFYKFDSVLREFFGHGAEGLEAKLFKSIIQTKETNGDVKNEWITIQDQNIAKTFLEALGDPDKKAILDSVLDKPLIVTEILKICKMPQTSGYRKINSLIEEGLLLRNGYDIKDNRKVTKYETIFKNIDIKVGKNSVRIKTQMNEEILEESLILRTFRLG